MAWMSRGDKLLERMRANPRDWRIDDVVMLCEAEGIACTPPSNGSHYKVKHPAVARILTIPRHRPIKPPYIRELVSFITEVRERSR
jgi:predicted RNA binding protein YcfA (HicA-like mRNA interferase family)